MKICIMKLLASVFILLGVLCTNLNLYPFNIYLQSVGVILWTVVGLDAGDKLILVNFIPQIPLFLLGYYIILS